MSKRPSLRYSVAVVVSFLLSGISYAQPSAGPFAARSVWRSELVATPFEPRKIKYGERQRGLTAVLFPPSAYAISRPISSDEFRMDLSKDGELVGLEADNVIGCSRKKGPADALQLLVGSTSNTGRICFIDLDRNGNFDHYAYISSMAEGLIQFEGVVTDIKRLDADLPYKAIDPRKMTRSNTVRVMYPNYSYGRIDFVFSVGNSDDGAIVRANSNPYVGYFRASIPFSAGSVEAKFLGVVFDLHREAKGDLLVGIEKPAEEAVVFCGLDNCWERLTILSAAPVG